jgi:hypothetical protein
MPYRLATGESPANRCGPSSSPPFHYRFSGWIFRSGLLLSISVSLGCRESKRRNVQKMEWARKSCSPLIVLEHPAKALPALNRPSRFVSSRSDMISRFPMP